MKGEIEIELTMTKGDVTVSLLGKVIIKAGDFPEDIGDAVQRVASELYRMAEIDHQLEVSTRKT